MSNENKQNDEVNGNNALFSQVTDWVNEHRIPFEAQNELFRILAESATWEGLFDRVALELNCLPSSFVSGNDHVFTAIAKLRAACATTQQATKGDERAAVERCAQICESVMDQSRNHLFRSAAKICAMSIRNPTQPCDRAPDGWKCSRVAGHEGPCAASQITTPSPVAGSAGQAALPEAKKVVADLLFALTERQKRNVIRSEDAYVDQAREFLAAPDVPEELHIATKQLVRRFAGALADKLFMAQRKYGYSDNWERKGWSDECRAELMRHIHKGDPRDVAAYCAFLWHHGESTASATPPTLADLHKELNKITWLGADEGWDRAIDAVRNRITEMLEIK